MSFVGSLECPPFYLRRNPRLCVVEWIPEPRGRVPSRSSTLHSSLFPNRSPRAKVSGIPTPTGLGLCLGTGPRTLVSDFAGGHPRLSRRPSTAAPRPPARFPRGRCVSCATRGKGGRAPVGRAPSFPPSGSAQPKGRSREECPPPGNRPQQFLVNLPLIRLLFITNRVIPAPSGESAPLKWRRVG